MLVVIMELTTAVLEKPLVWLAFAMFLATELQIFRHCKVLAFMLMMMLQVITILLFMVVMFCFFYMKELLAIYKKRSILPLHVMWWLVTLGKLLVFQKETYIYFYPPMFDITPETQSCTITTQQPLTFNNNSNHSNLQQPQVLTTEIAPEWGVTR